MMEEEEVGLALISRWEIGEDWGLQADWVQLYNQDTPLQLPLSLPHSLTQPLLTRQPRHLAHCGDGGGGNGDGVDDGVSVLFRPG